MHVGFTRLYYSDAAHHYFMISAGQFMLHRAFDDGNGTVQPRAASEPALVLHALPCGRSAAPGELADR